MGAKAIARLLNRERVAPPRMPRGRVSRGWAATTIAGASKKTLGILHNPIYVGRLVWNRSQKVRNPDTGKRVMRSRPQEEWVTVDAPELRIIPPELWEAVQRRSEERRLVARGNLTGRKPKYLFSGLLKCAECGSNYVVQSGAYYGCAAHTNRGPEICSNWKQVRRDKLEAVLLSAVFDEVFSPDTVAYLSQKVNEALARRSEPQDVARKRRAEELAQARRELENIETFIRQGNTTPTTSRMLTETERRIAELEMHLQGPAAGSKITYLPAVVDGYIRDLAGTLGHGVEKAKSLLAKMIGPVTLRREGDRLVAELRGTCAAC